MRDWPAKKGRKPFAEPADETLRSDIISLTRQWRGQSIWAFWCSSRIVRYYLARWAQEEGARRPEPMAASSLSHRLHAHSLRAAPLVQALMRFALRCEALESPTGEEAERTCRGLIKDASAIAVRYDLNFTGDLTQSVEGAIGGIVEAPSSSPCNAPLFSTSIGPLHRALKMPDPFLSCDSFLAATPRERARAG